MPRMEIERERIDKVKQKLKGLLQHPEDLTYEDYLKTKLITRGQVGKKILFGGVIAAGAIAVGSIIFLIVGAINMPQAIDTAAKITFSALGIGWGVGVASALVGVEVAGNYSVERIDEYAYVQAVKELKKEKEFDFKKLKSLFKQYKKSDKFIEDKKQDDIKEVESYYWRKRYDSSPMIRRMLRRIEDKKVDKIKKKAQKKFDKRAGVKPIKKSETKVEVEKSDNNLTLS